MQKERKRTRPSTGGGSPKERGKERKREKRKEGKKERKEEKMKERKKESKKEEKEWLQGTLASFLRITCTSTNELLYYTIIATKRGLPCDCVRATRMRTTVYRTVAIFACAFVRAHASPEKDLCIRLDTEMRKNRRRGGAERPREFEGGTEAGRKAGNRGRGQEWGGGRGGRRKG